MSRIRNIALSGTRRIGIALSRMQRDWVDPCRSLAETIDDNYWRQLCMFGKHAWVGKWRAAGLRMATILNPTKVRRWKSFDELRHDLSRRDHLGVSGKVLPLVLE